jgi:hypothetical protein
MQRENITNFNQKLSFRAEMLPLGQMQPFLLHDIFGIYIIMHVII